MKKCIRWVQTRCALKRREWRTKATPTKVFTKFALLWFIYLPTSFGAIDGAVGQGIERVNGSDWEPATINLHETQWVRRDDQGNVTGSFVEIQSGLNRQLDDGTWTRASDQIEVFEKGAIVRGAQFKATFAGNSGAPDGIFDIQLPQGGGRLRGRCVGLAYTASNGDSVFIAEMKPVQGLLVGRNEILYPDCFTGGIKADLRYRVTVGSIVQDVILRSKLPSVQEFGLADGRLEVWTEFLEAPQARKDVWAARTRGGKTASDCVIDFGPMKIGAGKAGTINDEGRLVLGNEAPVHKEYEQLEGRIYLIEGLPADEVITEINALPDREQASVDRNDLKQKFQARSGDKTRKRPLSLAASTRPPAGGASAIRKVALADIKKSPGFALDFDLGSSYTSYTFRSDTTYYCSGIVDLYGTGNIFEGGTVIKFAPTNNAQIIINSGASATFKTDQYRPAIFCARDDQSAGTALNTNSISGFYADPALVLFIGGSVTANTFKELRISDCKRGLYVQGQSGGNYNLLTHAQFVRCNQGLTCNTALINVRNVLFDGSTSSGAITNFLAVSSQMRCEHLTIDGSTQLYQDYGGNTLTFTNSLLIAITNWGSTSFTSVNNYTNSSSSGLFSSIGAGNHYLASGSALRDAGITSINSDLATALTKRTTFPPTLLTNTISVDTTLAPQVPLDIDTPDLGYHYSKLDYIADAVVVTNALVTLTNGVTIGTYFGYTLYLNDGSQLACQGQPNNLNRFVDYSRVQEQPIFLGSSTAATIIPYKYTNSLTSSVFVNFTEFLGWNRYHIYEQSANQADTLTVKNSIFSLGNVWLKSMANSSATANFNNNLFERSSFTVDSTNTMAFYNDLHWQGNASINNAVSNKVTIGDSVFDNLTISNQSVYVINTNNAYISATNRLTPNCSSDIVLSSFNYATGALGYFYHSSGNLVNRGSRLAADAGLYHHTVLTGDAPEGGTQVDIGFHYVSTACNSVETTWFDDSLPGASPSFVGSSWSWVSANPTPYSSQRAYQSPIASGTHEMYFSGASATMSVGTGDTLIAYVYLDSTNTPTEVMMEFQSGGSYEHRAYWGANNIGSGGGWGTDGTDSRRHIGSLPAAGQWVRLEVAASQIGLEGGTLTGMAFTIYDGRATWDAPGKLSGTHCFDTDGDGIPDYLEDTNGNGIVDSGETDPNLSNRAGSGAANLIIFTPLQ